jgi:hypothetical protein
MRIRLRPGLHRAWREPDAVQFSLGENCTIVEGLTESDCDLLDALWSGVDTENLESEHPDHPRAVELVGLLASAHLLVPEQRVNIHPRMFPDADVLALTHPQCADGRALIAARSGYQVLVQGRGRIALSIASLLSAAGVSVHAGPRPRRRGEGTPPFITEGDVSPTSASPEDIGRPEEETAWDVVHRAAWRRPVRKNLARAWDLVILVDHAVADSPAADHLLTADIPHLSVVVREIDVLVGPFVIPGHTSCLRCLDLHRTDADPTWPRLLVQYLGTRELPAPPQESVLATLAASLACLQVLTHLDGHAVPAAAGATLETSLPDGLMLRRPWPVHPDCGCRWPLPGTTPSHAPE